MGKKEFKKTITNMEEAIKLNEKDYNEFTELCQDAQREESLEKLKLQQLQNTANSL